MHTRQQDAVPPEREHGPPLVAKRGEDAADQKVRCRATRHRAQLAVQTRRCPVGVN